MRESITVSMFQCLSSLAAGSPHPERGMCYSQGYERCEVKNYETPYMSTTSVNVLPRALDNATDIRLIRKSKAPREKLAFHPFMVSQYCVAD